MIKGIEWRCRKMTRLDSCKILLRIKEEKAWWTKRKLGNSKAFFRGKWEKLISLIIRWMILPGKVRKMTSKSDFWDNRFRRKEEKALQTKTLSTSYSIFWPRKCGYCMRKMPGTQTFRTTWMDSGTKYRSRGTRV